MVNRTINDLSSAPSIATTTLFLGRRSGQTADEKFSATLMRDFMSNTVNGLVAGDTGAAGANTTALQTALTAGGTVRIRGAGTYWINDTLLIGGNTSFIGEMGVELRMVSGTSKSLLQNLTPGSKTDKNIRVADIQFHGNRGSKTTAYSVVEFNNVDYFWFENCQFREGLRTGTFPTVSRRGEGLELRACQYGYVNNCYAADNSYDGFKPRNSKDICFANIIGENNGRSALQIAGDTEVGTIIDTACERILVDNVSCLHSTGTPSAQAPTTSGVYFHGAYRCVVNNVTVNGMHQGIGFVEASTDNVVSNLTLRTRWVDKTAVEFEDLSGGICSRNLVTNVHIRPLSGAAGTHVRIFSQGDFNRVSNLWASNGDGTGTWVAYNIASGVDRTQFNDWLVTSSPTVTNNGTNTNLSNVIIV